MKSNVTLTRYWKDIVLQATGNSSAQVIGLLGMPVLARIYSPEDFATQNIFLQIVMFLAGLMTWRYEYFFQMLNVPSHAKHLFLWVVKLGFISGSILTVLIYFIGDYIAKFLGVEKIGVYLLFAPWTAYLISVALALQHCMQRDGLFKVSAISEVFGKIFYVGSGFTLSWFGTIGLILTSPFSALGKIFFMRVRLRELLSRPTLAVARDEHPCARHAKGANAMVLSHLFLTVSGSLPIFFISYQYGVEELGQFTMVMATIFLPSGLIGVAIGQVFYQRAAQQFRESNDIVPLWRETVRRLVFFGAPIYILAILVSHIIYPLILGVQWSDAGSYARIFSVAAFFSFISSPLDRISLILGVNRYLPIMHLVRMSVSVFFMGLAYFYHWDFVSYLFSLTVQMSFLYLTDMVFGRVFLARKQN